MVDVGNNGVGIRDIIVNVGNDDACGWIIVADVGNNGVGVHGVVDNVEDNRIRVY